MTIQQARLIIIHYICTGRRHQANALAAQVQRKIRLIRYRNRA